MRKYDVLKLLFESAQAVQPIELSKKLNTSITNVYTYLKGLNEEGLIQKDSHGSYSANQINEKLSQILDLQAMAPEDFHKMISPAFKAILSELCKKTSTGRDAFAASEIGKIEQIAVRLRIVLKLSRRPVAYCLKINEPLVKTLLEYHDLKALFTLADFNNAVSGASVRELRGIVKETESDRRVMEMCDSAYARNEDISVIVKSNDFALDERLNELIRTADSVSKEYMLFLNGLDENVRRSILAQWEKRYIYNTNSIEGNTMTEKEVAEYLDQKKRPRGISRRELYETRNMRHALAFLRRKQHEETAEPLVKDLHFEVQKDIDEENPGDYKSIYNYIQPNSPTTPPKHVKERMRMLMEWYRQSKGSMHPLVLASIFHMQFEMIHPFGDGNGRVGRLLLNQILVQNRYHPVTILERTKLNYYNTLANRSVHQFMLYFLTTYIEEYRR